jgi:hypothetical protein
LCSSTVSLAYSTGHRTEAERGVIISCVHEQSTFLTSIILPWTANKLSRLTRDQLLGSFKAHLCTNQPRHEHRESMASTMPKSLALQSARCQPAGIHVTDIGQIDRAPLGVPWSSAETVPIDRSTGAASKLHSDPCQPDGIKCVR